MSTAEAGGSSEEDMERPASARVVSACEKDRAVGDKDAEVEDDEDEDEDEDDDDTCACACGPGGADAGIWELGEGVLRCMLMYLWMGEGVRFLLLLPPLGVNACDDEEEWTEAATAALMASLLAPSSLSGEVPLTPEKEPLLLLLRPLPMGLV